MTRCVDCETGACPCGAPGGCEACCGTGTCPTCHGSLRADREAPEPYAWKTVSGPQPLPAPPKPKRIKKKAVPKVVEPKSKPKPKSTGTDCLEKIVKPEPAYRRLKGPPLRIPSPPPIVGLPKLPGPPRPPVTPRPKPEPVGRVMEIPVCETCRRKIRSQAGSRLSEDKEPRHDVGHRVRWEKAEWCPTCAVPFRTRTDRPFATIGPPESARDRFMKALESLGPAQEDPEQERPEV
jgi:hypothetical protein